MVVHGREESQNGSGPVDRGVSEERRKQAEIVGEPNP